MKNQAGISLSEVLISLFLASVIMTTLIQLYLSSKHQYIEAEKILATGFDLQWVSDLLSDSIRRAGFTPCLNIDHLQIVDRRHNQNSVWALQVENQPNQFIRVNRMSENFANIIKIQSPTRILVQNSGVFHEKHPVLIADCEHAEVHELFSVDQQVTESLLTLNKPLIFSYNTLVYVGEFLEEHWFIKKNAKGENSFYYQLIQTEEVTPLIHSLHIKNQRVKNKQFLEVILGLKEDKTHKLKVVVRGS